MHATLTIKVGADSKDEAMSLPSKFDALRTTVSEAIRQHGFAGLPAESVSVRWLVVAGEWAPLRPAFAEPVSE